jgi:hypothetical protein
MARVCTHCGGRGKLPNYEIELIDPKKGLVEGNIKWNENGFHDCYSCEGKGIISQPPPLEGKGTTILDYS